MRNGLPPVGSLSVIRVLVIVLALALASTLIALALLVPSRPTTPLLLSEPMVVTSSLSPTTALFGDRISAEIDVYTRDQQVDPGTVHVRAEFRPYQVVDTEVTRSSEGSVSVLRTRLALQCLTSTCLPAARSGRVFRFEPATVSYRQGTRSDAGRSHGVRSRSTRGSRRRTLVSWRARRPWTVVRESPPPSCEPRWPCSPPCSGWQAHGSW